MNSNTRSTHNVVLVEPEDASSRRLKEALRAVPQFGKVVSDKSLNGALSQITSTMEDSAEIVFLSHKFELAEIGKFVDSTKESVAGSDAAFIFLLDGAEQDADSMKQKIEHGADGFLCEPFSVEALVEIVELSNRIKKEREAVRARMAMGFMVKDLVNTVDELTFLKVAKECAESEKERFAELRNNLENLSEDDQAHYFDLLMKMFADAEVPKELVKLKKGYKGMSDRSRKLIQKKLMAKMKARREE